MRNYSSVDMIRFLNFSKLKENKNKPNIDLIKEYNIKYPELSEKDKLINLCKALKLNTKTKKIKEDYEKSFYNVQKNSTLDKIYNKNK